MCSIRIVRKVEVLLSKERECGKIKGSEDGAGHMGVTESCSSLLKAVMPWCGMGSEQCVAPHFFAAEAVEMDVELAGEGRGTASPLYWLIWTKSTSASTEEHRIPYNLLPWQLPGAISPSRAHFLKLRGAQVQMSGGNQTKVLEEGTPAAECHVWLLPHCLQNSRSPRVVQQHRAAFPCTIIKHLGEQRAPATVPISLLPFHVYPSLPCCSSQAPTAPAGPDLPLLVPP